VSVVPAASFLVDFGRNDVAAKIIEETPLVAPTFASDADMAARIEEAYARGLEEGRQAAELESLARADEQKAAAEQSLAAARQAWCAEESPRIAERLAASLSEMESRIGESVEAILRPFLSQAARDQAIRQLRAIIQDLVSASPGLTLEVTGPEDLLEAVRASLPASVVTVSYVASDACDVEVKIGASIIETRIAEWLRNIEGQV